MTAIPPKDSLTLAIASFEADIAAFEGHITRDPEAPDTLSLIERARRWLQPTSPVPSTTTEQFD